MNLAAASTWLSQVMHSALLLPSKILMFFIIFLLASSLLLSLMTQFMICVIPSIKSAGVAGDVSFCCVCIRVLVLGWLLSSKLNNGLLCVSVGCVAAAVPINGGGVTVGLLLFGCGSGSVYCHVASCMLLCRGCSFCSGCRILFFCIHLSCGLVLHI